MSLKRLKLKVSALLADMEDPSLVLEQYKKSELSDYYQGEVYELLQIVQTMEEEE